MRTMWPPSSSEEVDMATVGSVLCEMRWIVGLLISAGEGVEEDA
jgi:hypothetical protein